MEGLDSLVIGVYHAVFDRLEVALDIGQRCAKLVGHVGSQLPALLPCQFEIAGHRVERFCQFTDIVTAGFRHPLAQIARAKTAGSCRKPSNRGQCLSGKHSHDQKSRKPAGNTRDQEGSLERRLQVAQRRLDVFEDFRYQVAGRLRWSLGWRGRWLLIARPVIQESPQRRLEKVSHRKRTLIVTRTLVDKQVCDQLAVHEYRSSCKSGRSRESLGECFKQALRIADKLVRIGDYHPRLVFKDHAPAVQIADLLNGVLDLVPILVRFERVTHQLFGTPGAGEFDFCSEAFGLDAGCIRRVDADARQ